MKTIYKSILSLVTLLACSCMPSWGEAYEIVTGFTADEGDPFGFNYGHGSEQYNQTYDRLVDGKNDTKWCCEGFESGYIKFHHKKGAYVYGYILTTGNDNDKYPGRNPDSWALFGQNPTTKEWEKLHEVKHDRTMEDANNVAYTFMLSLPTQIKYRYFKLELEGTRGGSAMQLTELQLLMADVTVACTHPKVIYHAPAAASCCSLGNTEYWECQNPLCGKLFKDEAATQPTTKSELTVSTEYSSVHTNLVHVDAVPSNCIAQGYYEYWTCDGCKKNFSDAEGTKEIKDLSSMLQEPKFNTINKEIGKYNSTNYYSGYGTYYGYSGSQNLYLASEIGAATSIQHIEFYCEGGSSLERPIKVYMAETEQSKITPESFIPAAQFTLVYDGSFTLGSSTGWEKLTLDTPFAYSGKKNLVIGIYSGDDGWSSITYRVSNSDEYNAIYRGNDGDSGYANIKDVNQKYKQVGRPLLRLELISHAFDNINGIGTCSVCATKEELESISTLALDDTKPYSRKTEAQVSKLSYTRNFATANQWESIYLPFAFKYTGQMVAQFDLAEIDTYGVSSDTNEDGMIDSKDEKVLLVQQREAGVTFKANHPYLIRPKNAGSITFSSDDGTLYKAEENSVSCGTLKDQLDFCGNNAPTKCKGYYVMKDGYLTKVTDEDEVLSSFTWYMTGSSKFAASSINTIKIVERGKHIHYDNNDDGQCDDCGYEFSIYPLTTAGECVSSGLEDYYVGYYAISKYWHLTKAMSMLDDYDEDSNQPLYFVLLNDIQVNGKVFNENGELLKNLKEWNSAPLKKKCIFDGNGHSIKGIYYTKPTGTKVAVFEYLDEEAEICDLGIEDSYFSYEFGGSAVPVVGTFVAEMKGGAIVNCWSNASIVACTGEKGGNIGGIAGYKEGGYIKNCTFNGSIELYETKIAQVGGIVGKSMPSSLSSSDFPYDYDHCHYSGTFYSKESTQVDFGGICGSAGDIKFNCCWADGAASYDNNIKKGYWGGIVGNAASEIEDNCGSDYYCGGQFINCANMMNLTNTKNLIMGGIVGGYTIDAGVSEEHIKAKNLLLKSCANIGKITNNGTSNYASQCCGDKSPIIRLKVMTGKDEYDKPIYSYEKSVFYYLASERESPADSLIGYTSEDFQSGYAAREILAQCDGKYWGQNIGDDKYPVPDQENHQKVYAVEHNGTQYVNDSIAEFTVTEGYSFVNTDAKEFKAHQATYSRKMPNQWGTLCLPFSIDYDPDNTEMTLFKLTEITKEGESDVLMFEEYEEGVIAGGTPLVVKVHAKDAEDKWPLEIKETDATFTKDTKIVNCGGDSGWKAKGIFENLKDGEGGQLDPTTAEGDIYYIAQNKFWYANQAFDMAAFRSWFEAPKSDGAAVRRFMIGEKSSDSSTNIQIIENEEDHTVRIIFNLAGQRQETLQKGLNIINNEKVLIK